MSTKKKAILGGIVVVILGAVIFFSIRAGRKDAVAVETAKVERKSKLIAMVSATGEIMPKEYVELQAEISGVITDLYVKEGDHVEKGDLLLRIDPVQTETELKAQEAILSATASEARNQHSQISVQETNVERDLTSVKVAEADLDKAKQLYTISQATFDRKQELFEDNLLSRDAYEQAKNEVVTTEAALKTAKMRLEQAEAQYRVSKMVLATVQGKLRECPEPRPSAESIPGPLPGPSLQDHHSLSPRRSHHPDERGTGRARCSRNTQQSAGYPDGNCRFVGDRGGTRRLTKRTSLISNSVSLPSSRWMLFPTPRSRAWSPRSAIPPSSRLPEARKRKTSRLLCS